MGPRGWHQTRCRQKARQTSHGESFGRSVQLFTCSTLRRRRRYPSNEHDRGPFKRKKCLPGPSNVRFHVNWWEKYRGFALLGASGTPPNGRHSTYLLSTSIQIIHLHVAHLLSGFFFLPGGGEVVKKMVRVFTLAPPCAAV